MATAITTFVNTDPTIKKQLSAALDSIIRSFDNQHLGNVSIEGITISNGMIRVQPGCPFN